MDSRLTAFLAIWGAALSTIGFLWQVFLFRKAHPQLHVAAHTNESPTGDEKHDWIEFEIRNRGGRATMIEEIVFVSYANWLLRILKFPNRIEYLFNQPDGETKLPVMIQTNETWRARCKIDSEHHHGMGTSRRQRSEDGELHYRVKCSHTNRRVAGSVKPERFWERM